ncbi:hypothetical protein PVAP13_3NG222763 [Panicum virgatum]|uniref:Uncharacterized protein n=1 Tax=Panicum virgatum TaxID=38727 RepID=A0A8T0UJ58_PANVG|nr:hypothetical protein PVAP13_3NG222763 [Panicum virgatum]
MRTLLWLPIRTPTGVFFSVAHLLPAIVRRPLPILEVVQLAELRQVVVPDAGLCAAVLQRVTARRLGRAPRDAVEVDPHIGLHARRLLLRKVRGAARRPRRRHGQRLSGSACSRSLGSGSDVPHACQQGQTSETCKSSGLHGKAAGGAACVGSGGPSQGLHLHGEQRCGMRGEAATWPACAEN